MRKPDPTILTAREPAMQPGQDVLFGRGCGGTAIFAPAQVRRFHRIHAFPGRSRASVALPGPTRRADARPRRRLGSSAHCAPSTGMPARLRKLDGSAISSACGQYRCGRIGGQAEFTVICGRRRPIGAGRNSTAPRIFFRDQPALGGIGQIPKMKPAPPSATKIRRGPELRWARAFLGNGSPTRRVRDGKGRRRAGPLTGGCRWRWTTSMTRNFFR